MHGPINIRKRTSEVISDSNRLQESGHTRNQTVGEELITFDTPSERFVARESASIDYAEWRKELF